ncbi:conserved hypothetical protein [Streptomyces lividans TK24]|uniref:Uncharacterized protein n=1 Tax=Streptomyces lividans TK24 TaxID=457428 RepID=A0ABM5RBW0_STRLI|nr:hypothetical protein SLIV_35175 [Streptomyces lividans TK24]EFD71406.1 conserved hypothetical protein [Streptomyces lividans TK24]KKD12129.1 hypothetical protein TR66_27985 [Streptomyces sp. WM6391]QSJ13527.1 hypothetical protein SLIVDG2_35175 [Streptomyces lividans]QTD74437.1 hypothetical protein SLIVYQS_35175 [Streptomyces lividans TK24] [Streptomyces lividans]
MKPWFGTAEIRHTPSPPNRTVALPPSEGTVYTPAPPSSHPGAPAPAGGRGAVVRGLGVGVGATVASGSVGSALVRDGDGLGLRLVGEGLGVAVTVLDTVGRGGAGSSFGAVCATGAVGRVDPTTKWIVMMTAVTLAAVQDSQMIR